MMYCTGTNAIFDIRPRLTIDGIFRSNISERHHQLNNSKCKYQSRNVGYGVFVRTLLPEET
jgi:hypothetical protein